MKNNELEYSRMDRQLGVNIMILLEMYIRQDRAIRALGGFLHGVC